MRRRGDHSLVNLDAIPDLVREHGPFVMVYPTEPPPATRRLMESLGVEVAIDPNLERPRAMRADDPRRRDFSHLAALARARAAEQNQRLELSRARARLRRAS